MKQKIFNILDDLEINYTNYEHEVVHSCDDAKWVDIPWKIAKSLLIRNKKSTNFYMIVLPDSKSLDTNIIRAMFDDSKMSFASEESMLEKIWLRPGSVSPFALINNTDRDIRVVFDESLKQWLIWFHPLQNDNTIVLEMSDVLRFLDNLWIKYYFWNL